jgi:4-hydroxy-3-methylbut-2-en-1-yl diphosphate reductase
VRKGDVPTDGAKWANRTSLAALMEKNMKVYLAKPRGFCAGVDRAIDVVEIALDIYGPPVYVRHEIVHNDHVVSELRKKGAVFLDDVTEIPQGSVTIFSAHGVSPAIREQAKERELKVIDATCPLVTKVHLEAIRYAKKGYTIILIGHRNHVEVEGTMGEAPDAMVLVESPEDVPRLDIANDEKMVYLTQTTLSIDDTQAVIDALKARFPHIESPPKDDICYATTNRQAAVKEMTDRCDMILVIGSPTSSNSNRLVEVAMARGCEAYLINDSSQMNIEMFANTKNLGITAGASAPEHLVQDVVRWLEKNSSIEFADLDVVEEDVQFTLPRELQALRQEKKAAAASS